MQPAITELERIEGVLTVKTLPPLLEVPVVLPRAGGYTLTLRAPGVKNNTSSEYRSTTSRTRLPSTALTSMLASRTRALRGIPLFLAGSLADCLVLLY